MSVKQIIEGWKNHLLPEEKKAAFLNELSKTRMDICNACPECSINKSTLRLDVHCTNCGCTLAAKTKCPSCSCPLDKWGEVNEPNYE